MATQTCDQHTTQGPAAAVAHRPDTSTAPPAADRLPPFAVVLHNDDHNEALYVAQTIARLTPLGPQRSFRTMITAHSRGRALVLVTHKERAELYRDQFASSGLTVTISPAG